MDTNVVLRKGYGICPVCQGTTKIPLTEEEKRWRPGQTEGECTNCGGQTMMGKASGQTPIDPATGLGCKHEYDVIPAGRCYTKYECRKCRYGFDIDSGG